MNYDHDRAKKLDCKNTIRLTYLPADYHLGQSLFGHTIQWPVRWLLISKVGFQSLSNVICENGWHASS